MPYFFISPFANTLLPSISAAAAVGPNVRMPAACSRSTTRVRADRRARKTQRNLRGCNTPVKIRRGNRQALCQLRYSCIAGRGIELSAARTFAQLFDNCMFAASAAYHKDVDFFHLTVYILIYLLFLLLICIPDKQLLHHQLYLSPPCLSSFIMLCNMSKQSRPCKFRAASFIYSFAGNSAIIL